MAPDARRIVETALRDRVICALCCTTALAAGVNFPARRVIICAPMVGNEELSQEKFTQICGRAGRCDVPLHPVHTCDTTLRYGYDSCGEAVLCCGADTAALAQQLVAGGGKTAVTSVLGAAMERFLLEMVCCCAARGGSALLASDGRDRGSDVQIEELQSIVRSSLHARCSASAHAADAAAAAAAADALDHSVIVQLRQLQGSGMVALDESRRCVRPTAEGSAVFVSGISLATAAQLRCDMSGMGLSCGSEEIQLVHMLVPPMPALLPRFDWRVIHDSVWPALDTRMIAAAAALHVEERHLYLLAYEKGASVAAEDELRMRRFMCACMLLEAAAASNIATVAERFQLELGVLHTAQEAVCAHAVCISEYLSVCRVWGVHAMCAAAVRRLRSGAAPDLHPLTEIRSCTAQRARALLCAGISSPLHVVKAGARGVLDALVRSCGAQPGGIEVAIVQHAAFLIGQEVKLLQRRVRDLLRAETG
jgi:DNA polymerase theta